MFFFLSRLVIGTPEFARKHVQQCVVKDVKYGGTPMRAVELVVFVVVPGFTAEARREGSCRREREADGVLHVRVVSVGKVICDALHFDAVLLCHLAQYGIVGTVAV